MYIYMFNCILRIHTHAHTHTPSSQSIHHTDWYGRGDVPQERQLLEGACRHAGQLVVLKLNCAVDISSKVLVAGSGTRGASTCRGSAHFLRVCLVFFPIHACHTLRVIHTHAHIMCVYKYKYVHPLVLLYVNIYTHAYMRSACRGPELQELALLPSSLSRILSKTPLCVEHTYFIYYIYTCYIYQFSLWNTQHARGW